MRPSRFAVGLAAISAACALAFPSGPVAAGNAGTEYAALGDSYASGVGAGNYLPESGECLRSTLAYPALFARAHEVSRFDFVACNGADTAAVGADQIKAVGPSTDLITLSVGGRDVGFDKVLTACVAGGDAECSGALHRAQTTAANRLPARLDATYAELVRAAPRARIMVMGYPRLFEEGECGTLDLSASKRQLLNRGAEMLNQVIAERAEQAGLMFVDVREQFDGHGVCGRQQVWINALVSPLVESFHPTALGHREGYLPALTEALPLAPVPAAVAGHHAVTH